MERRHILAGGAALVAALPLARAARAQTTDQAAMDEEKMPALTAGAFSMMASQIAAERATDPSVRAFALLEVAEQEATARAFGVEPGTVNISDDHAAQLDQLSTLEGAEFDRQYVTARLAGHEELRQIHADYAESGSDPMARGASMVGVPSIDTHLSILTTLQDTLGQG